MQGTIVKVAVEDGDTVAAGDLVVVLEAMKMEQPLTAHKAGTVTGLSAEVGAVVTSGAVICTIADAASERLSRAQRRTGRPQLRGRRAVVGAGERRPPRHQRRRGRWSAAAPAASAGVGADREPGLRRRRRRGAGRRGAAASGGGCGEPAASSAERAGTVGRQRVPGGRRRAPERPRPAAGGVGMTEDGAVRR